MTSVATALRVHRDRRSRSSAYSMRTESHCDCTAGAVCHLEAQNEAGEDVSAVHLPEKLADKELLPSLEPSVSRSEAFSGLVNSGN